MLPLCYYEVIAYTSANGKAYFRDWFARLDANTANKITAALYKMENGNFTNTKSVGGGVLEFKINSGPGYRIYFGKVGENIILLLTGGTKRRQNKDIEQAIELLNEYKRKTLH